VFQALLFFTERFDVGNIFLSARGTFIDDEMLAGDVISDFLPYQQL
jgi:hypothetical protein